MLLQAKGIHKYYSNGKERLHILKEISLSIAQGEIAAVLGPSGAGKSTLLHILGGLDSPESGEVFFEGQDISSFSDRESADSRSEKELISCPSKNTSPLSGLSNPPRICKSVDLPAPDGPSTAAISP